MKKFIFFIALAMTFVYAGNNAQIEKKLNMIIERMNKMQKQLDSKDKEIKTLKQEVKKQKEETKKEFIVNSCDKIKVANLDYIYHGGVIPYYVITFTIKNKYPYTIKRFAGKLLLKDKDDITMLTEYIESKKVLKKDGTIQIKRNHMINSDLESTLKDENPTNVQTLFKPSSIEFTNGKTVKCGGIF